MSAPIRFFAAVASVLPLLWLCQDSGPRDEYPVVNPDPPWATPKERAVGSAVFLGPPTPLDFDTNVVSDVEWRSCDDPHISIAMKELLWRLIDAGCAPCTAIPRDDSASLAPHLEYLDDPATLHLQEQWIQDVLAGRRMAFPSDYENVYMLVSVKPLLVCSTKRRTMGLSSITGRLARQMIDIHTSSLVGEFFSTCGLTYGTECPYQDRILLLNLDAEPVERLELTLDDGEQHTLDARWGSFVVTRTGDSVRFGPAAPVAE